jgi:hypothetical protein
MELLERIEKRRFVGREFLLFLWFESEIFEGTLSTRAHGPFGLWIEKQLVLAEGKEETRIKGAAPGSAREGKESLRRGKLPMMAGLRLSMGEREYAFTLKADQLALAGLQLPAVLGKEEATDEEHETFYERMHLARDLEAVLEALYQDFLALRLSDAWDGVVLPAMRAWVEGREVDADRYRQRRRPRKKSARLAQRAAV